MFAIILFTNQGLNYRIVETLLIIVKFAASSVQYSMTQISNVIVNTILILEKFTLNIFLTKHFFKYIVKYITYNYFFSEITHAINKYK